MSLPTISYHTAYIGFTSHKFKGTLSWTPAGKLLLASAGLPKVEFRMDREVDDISVGLQMLGKNYAHLVPYQMSRLESRQSSAAISFHHIYNRTLPWLKEWESDFGPGICPFRICP
jgi:hypothetical protein